MLLLEDLDQSKHTVLITVHSTGDPGRDTVYFTCQFPEAIEEIECLYEKGLTPTRFAGLWVKADLDPAILDAAD